MDRAPIEDRLMASLKFDAISGDEFERGVVASQIKEAIAEIKRLRVAPLETAKGGVRCLYQHYWR